VCVTQICAAGANFYINGARLVVLPPGAQNMSSML